MRFSLRKLSKPNQVMLFWICIYTIIGWYVLTQMNEITFVLPQTLLWVGAILVGLIVPSFIKRFKTFLKYVLISSLVWFTPMVIYVFHSNTALLTHMLLVMILSAFYAEIFLVLFAAIEYGAVVAVLIMNGTIATTNHGIYTWSLLMVPLIITVILLGHLVYIYNRKLKKSLNVEHLTYYEKFEQKEHLVMIGQIAASIAHDIRNPLTSISGFVQLIEKNERRETYKQYYQIMRSEIGRIDALIREVLVLSKTHKALEGELEEVNLFKLFEKISLLMNPELKNRNIQLVLRVDQTIFVKGLEDKLEQVFLNLLRNAFEAVQSNGLILIQAYSEMDKNIITITDTGPGFSDASMAQLFTPFFTTKSDGTGLGLSICKSIVEAHDGKIIARNALEGGAQFSLTFPKV